MRRSEHAAIIEKQRQQKQEAESLVRVFARLDKKKDDKVDAEEVHEYLRKVLKYHKYKLSDVRDMLWEVDDECEGALSFRAFKMMWDRSRNDLTGCEPRKFFNIVEFMVHDKDGGGSIDIEETMEILFDRFGKDKLDAAVKEFVSHDIDGDAEIQFAEFLEMDRRSDVGNVGADPGFLVSKGVIAQTTEENDRLCKKFGLVNRTQWSAKK